MHFPNTSVMLYLLSALLLGSDGAMARKLTQCVTEVTTDLPSDGVIKTATIDGTFCELPTVFAVEPDGMLEELVVLSSGENFITVDVGERVENFNVRICCADVDGDGDGVDDNYDDDCPDTVIGDAVNDSGCSISQLCPCNGIRRQYRRCVLRTSLNFFSNGWITLYELGQIVLEAFRSDCGNM